MPVTAVALKDLRKSVTITACRDLNGGEQLWITKVLTHPPGPSDVSHHPSLAAFTQRNTPVIVVWGV